MRAATIEVNSVSAALSGAASVFHTIASPTRGASGVSVASDTRCPRCERAGDDCAGAGRERDPRATLERTRAKAESYDARAGADAHTLEHAVDRQQRLVAVVHRR